MGKGFFKVPKAVNEPILSYGIGTKEREQLKAMLGALRAQQMDIPMYINGKKVFTSNKIGIYPPHDIKHKLGEYSQGDATHISMAIESAMAAKPKWESLSWEHRAAIFLKAADLLAGPYRARMNAATMLGQSKNAYQAEIDAACEMADFFRFGVEFMSQMYDMQPISPRGVWNRSEYRPLDGFVFALTPFNFTSIAGNLPAAPAMLGNTVVWKPSKTAIYSAQVIMELFQEAGLPDGVINLVYCSGPVAADVVFSHPDFSGFHFTGSTGVFQQIWKTIGNNIHLYKSYPRIVGETGGKDFIFLHPSADVKAAATAISRGAFEYQGQKCSAASRVYIPDSLWSEVKEYVLDDVHSFKMGPPEDFSNFINAVIDESSFDKLAAYIDRAKTDEDAEIIAGGHYDKSVGYFIEPTIILTSNPKYVTMEEELFGPILTIYVYDDENLEEILDVLDSTSMYALTGAIFAQDRFAIEHLTRRLKNCAGNFYINDKCTGAVVGQQPFGGARGSGTNDKAGSLVNMFRWTSIRTIKETFDPPTDYRYPFMENEKQK